MIYELRTYRALPGKLPAMLARFEKRVMPYWEKYGIRPVGFWTTIIGPSHLEMYYLLAWESLAERERKWDAFATDPQWRASLAESEADGQIVDNAASCLLKPTAFSAMQ
mgnify:CR=1 FL=1